MAIRFGVAGTAYWSQEVHVRGLQSRPDVELVGIWGRNQAAAQCIAGANALQSFASFEEMLAAVDAVSIAVAPAAQPALACMAAQAGKHLLLEKPLGISVDTVAPVVENINRVGVASVVFFMRRFVPIIERSIQQARQRQWKAASVRVHSAALSTTTPFTNSRWRQNAGAELWDIGPHVLSILHPILGRVLAVQAERRSEGVTRFRTVHERGATADVSLTLRASSSTTCVEYRFDDDVSTLTLPEPTLNRSEALAGAAGDLIRLIENGGRAHRCDAAFGLEVVRVLEAAELSIRQMGSVKL